MVEFKVNKCPKCGKLAEIITTNNPISPGICLNCLKRELDPSILSQADFFCRAYNLPFDADKWLEFYNKCGDNVFKFYTKYILETNPKNLYYQTVTSDMWKQMDEEIQNCRTFEQLLSRTNTVKDSFMKRNKIKWGGDYTFEEYLQLENLFVNTLRANDISNPMQIDAIKKACKISVELDKAINSGDSKGIKDLTAAYGNFVKTAQIDDVISSANDDCISTVADLADYIEKCGGQFKYYDNVPRDIVDKTIADIKNYISDLVINATGLTSMLDNISATYNNKIEMENAESASSDFSIEEIIKKQKEEFDEDTELEELNDIEMDNGDDEDELFG